MSFWHIELLRIELKIVERWYIFCIGFCEYVLILNVIQTSCFKQVGTGTTKTRKVVECSKNTCLENSTGPQVYW